MCEIFPRVRAIAAVILMLALWGGGRALASVPGAAPFHRGGAGDCDGCHIMHPDEPDPSTDPTTGGGTTTTTGGGSGGITITIKSVGGGSPRLKGSDPSSTCLRCHEAQPEDLPQQHFVATGEAMLGGGVPPRQLTPAGDFGWLKKSYAWGGERSPGERHGHSIVAADYNYQADSRLTISPGGSYPAERLSCISCHDPHGTYRRFTDGTIGTAGVPVAASGSYASSPDPGPAGAVGTYRLLAGKGYQPKLSSAPPFSADPPAAVAPDDYNRGESGADTRVAYGSGMSEWCGNCHAGIHNDTYPAVRRHPAGSAARLTSEVTAIYNAYLASGNMNGSVAAAYTSMVPYEMGSDDYRLLKGTANSTGSDRHGPSGNANVMCLSCHRAHASGWDSMTRWDMHSEFIVYDGRYPGTDNGAPASAAQGRTEAEVQAAFYGRPASAYAAYQRSLCNKCHGKD